MTEAEIIANLRDRIEYDPETGELTWKLAAKNSHPNPQTINTFNTRFAGKPALACIQHGYKIGRINGRHIFAHRAAWMIVYGKAPETIDHINGNGLDNRLCNLRNVSHEENHRNTSIHKNNKTGVSGVCQAANGRYLAYIRIDGKPVTIGRFRTFEKAVMARKEAERERGYHPNHGRPK